MKWLARLLVVAAARRWPADLAETMAAEWLAEIEALRVEPGMSPLRRQCRVLAFAGSLALSPAVEAEGAEPLARIESWGRWLAGAAGVTLLAGGLFNGVHAVQHRAGGGWAAGALLGAVAIMVVAGRRQRGPVALRVVAIGAGLFGFLLAGNRIAVMPFMGWRDILPAVLVWTGGTVLSAYGKRFALVFGLLTLEIATVAGSLHAAGSLGVSPGSAALWFPLTLLPGGTVAFGPALAGGLQASQVLLGNAAAMVGPMMLCSVFVLVPRRRSVDRATRDLRIPLGVGATVAALAAAEAIRRMPAGTIEGTLHRLADNSTVFGFGFLAHTPGRVVVALVAGLVAAQVGVARRI